jgi:hypothetical protein
VAYLCSEVVKQELLISGLQSLFEAVKHVIAARQERRELRRRHVKCSVAARGSVFASHLFPPKGNVH